MSNFRNVVRSCSPEALSVVGRDFEGLFDQLFGAPSTNCKVNGEQVVDRTKYLRVPTSIWEKEEKLYVALELPGVAKDAIEVTFDKGDILVQAVKKAPELGEHKSHHTSRLFGTLQQRIAVGDAFDPESIEATYADGVLELTVSKKPVVQPKKIEIK